MRDETMRRLMHVQLMKARTVLREVIAAGETSDDMLEELEIEISNCLRIVEAVKVQRPKALEKDTAYADGYYDGLRQGKQAR